MRKLVLLLIIAIATNVMAYTPIVVEGYRWNVVTRNAYVDGKNTVIYGTHVEEFDGDSVIEGVTYKKMWRSYPENPEQRTLKGLIREDVETQKVWAYGNGFEALMYDFDVEVGDTVSLLSWLHYMENITAEGLEGEHTLVDLVVDKVEMVTIADLEPIKKITFYATYDKDRKFDIYERFGSLRGWLRSDFDFVDGGGITFLTCAFDANGELLFKPRTGVDLIDNSQDCEIDTSFVPKSYIGMVIPGYSWNVVNRRAQLDENGTIEYKTFREKIEGDTTINNVYYYKLYRSVDVDLLEYEFVAPIRDDSYNRKVWALIGDKEYVIYDFDCEEGDKTTVLKSLATAKQEPETIELTIKSIEEFEDLTGAQFRKFVATIEDFPFDVVYYERYGSENGWYSRPYDGIVGGGIDFLFCAWGVQQNYLLFKPDHNNELDKINACYLNETRTDVADVEFQSNAVYYNGENNALVFDVENITNITIYDAMGKMVVNSAVATGDRQLPLNLNSGIYIVSITTDNQQSIYNKIVIK